MGLCLVCACASSVQCELPLDTPSPLKKVHNHEGQCKGRKRSLASSSSKNAGEQAYLAFTSVIDSSGKCPSLDENQKLPQERLCHQVGRHQPGQHNSR